MTLPFYLAAGGAALVGFSLLSGRKMVIGNSGPMMVKSVGNGGYMRPDAADAFNAMAADAAADGVTILAGSAFRSVLEQAVLYAAYLARAMRYPKVAEPGKSNHGNGTAIDIAMSQGVSVQFGTAAFSWLTANAWKYGFNWNEARSMKEPEPWHWGFSA